MRFESRAALVDMNDDGRTNGLNAQPLVEKRDGDLTPSLILLS